MYMLSVGLRLGSSQTGLTLSAQLVDTTGASVGTAVAAGFVEFGSGNYSWNYGAFPDRFRGAVKFSAASVLKACACINPEEGELREVAFPLTTPGQEFSTHPLPPRYRVVDPGE